MRFRSPAIAAALAVLSCTTAFAADDIAGVAIGSSLSAAKDAISKANPNYKLSPLMLKSGKEGGVTAVTLDRMPGTGAINAGGPSDEFAALQNDSGKVWFLARVQRLAEGARIKKDILLTSVTEKFGKPSGQAMMDYGFIWQFDRAGKQYFGSGSGPCESMLRAGSNLPGVTVGAPHMFSPTCGKLITVFATQQPDGMIPHYVVSIIDAKAMFDEINARDAQAAADQRKKLLDEQAKGVKPKI